MEAQYAVEAVERGRRAQQAWGKLSVKQRLKYVDKLRQMLVRDHERWIEVFGQEVYKTPMDVLSSELMFTAQALQFYEKHADHFLRTKRKPTPLHFWGQRSYVHYEPIGLIAVISPWNFPLQLSMVPAISALIAGNAVIVKPSEHVPRINALIEQWLSESGLPEDIIQLVHGDGQVGQMIIDAKPDKLFFTGGNVAGQKVYARAALHMIPCVLELGGNDAMIVCEDANLERAAQAAVWGAFMNAGQVCIGVERVYVHVHVHDSFVQRVTEITRTLKLGITTEDDIGGMATLQGWNRVHQLIHDAVADGATIHAGITPRGENTIDTRGSGVDRIIGENLDEYTSPYYPPTILTNVHDDMDIVKEETFGPVMSILTFEQEEDAINRANAGEYGLNAYVFSSNLKKARNIAGQLKVGNCYINDVITNISNMNLPFGGIKGSGFGQYHGADGLYLFSHQKSIMEDRGKRNRQLHWYPYGTKNFTILKRIFQWLYR